MAADLQAARSICNRARSTLASANDDLFLAADEAKSATNAALDYLDTSAPSKLADYRSHLANAEAYLQRGGAG